MRNSLQLLAPPTRADPRRSRKYTCRTQLGREVAVAGRTVIMTTHDLRRGYLHADRIAILSRGKIAHDTPTSALAVDDLPKLYADVTGAATAR